MTVDGLNGDSQWVEWECLEDAFQLCVSCRLQAPSHCSCGTDKNIPFNTAFRMRELLKLVKGCREKATVMPSVGEVSSG